MLSHLISRPARLRLGGRFWRVSQLQLFDLAWIEEWATGGAGQFPCELLDTLAIEDETARHEGLRSLYDAAEVGGAATGSDAWCAAIASPAGRAVALWRSLRKRPQKACQGKRPTRVEVVELMQRMTPTEFSLAEAVIWAHDPLDSVAWAIDKEIGVASQSPHTKARPADWLKSFAALAKMTGWDVRQFGRLTLNQYQALCIYAEEETDESPVNYDGKHHPIACGEVKLSKEDLNKRRVFWGKKPMDTVPPMPVGEPTVRGASGATGCPPPKPPPSRVDRSSGDGSEHRATNPHMEGFRRVGAIVATQDGNAGVARNQNLDLPIVTHATGIGKDTDLDTNGHRQGRITINAQHGQIRIILARGEDDRFRSGC